MTVLLSEILLITHFFLHIEHNPSSSPIKIVTTTESDNGEQKKTRSGRRVKNEPKVEEEEEMEEEEQPSTSREKPKTKSGRWNEGLYPRPPELKDYT